MPRSKSHFFALGSFPALPVKLSRNTTLKRGLRAAGFFANVFFVGVVSVEAAAATFGMSGVSREGRAGLLDAHASGARTLCGSAAGAGRHV